MIEVIDFTFLTEDEMFKSYKPFEIDRLLDTQLEVFKKRDREAIITDFALLLGGFVTDDYWVRKYPYLALLSGGFVTDDYWVRKYPYGYGEYYTEHHPIDNRDKESLASRKGWYWIRSFVNSRGVRAISYDARLKDQELSQYGGAARPVASYSTISEISTNGVSSRAEDGILEIEFGAYPQQVASRNMQVILENQFQRKKMLKTGNIFTLPSTKCSDDDKKGQIETIMEYEYSGKRYIRVEANPFQEKEIYLSNGEQYKKGDTVWIEVQPVKWWVDEKSQKIISEKLLFAGDNFTNTRIFMDRYFSKDLVNYIFEVKNSINEEIPVINDDIPNLDTDNTVDLLHFGNELFVHSQYIAEEMRQVIKKDTLPQSINIIDELIESSYQRIEPEKEKKKKGFLKLFFGPKEEENSTPELQITESTIETIFSRIDQNLEILEQEIIGYDEIDKFINAYLNKNRVYHLVTENKLESLTHSVEELNSESPDCYQKLINLNRTIQIVRDKLRLFKESEEVMKTQLITVNNGLVNHALTMNVLNIAKNFLLPVILIQLAGAKGKTIERDSMEISNNIMKLFQSMLKQNAETTRDNLGQLKFTMLDEKTLNLISGNVQNYLDTVKTFEPLKTMSTNSTLSTGNSPSTLELNPSLGETNHFQLPSENTPSEEKPKIAQKRMVLSKY